jgi:cell division protein FtsQ
MALSATIDHRPMFRPQRARRVRAVLRAGSVAAALVLTWWVGDALTDPEFMPVRNVRVEGEFKHLLRADLHGAIAPYVAGSFFRVDVDAARAAAAHLPWVASVSVRRVWPDALHVTVRERIAVARWGNAALLTEEGAAFTPDAASYPPGLPELSGPAGSEAQVLTYRRAIDAALQPLGQRVQKLTLDERRALTVQLNNGVELLLGREDVDGRVQRYAAAYHRAFGARAGRLVAVDLRYTNGFAARWSDANTSR